MGLDMYAYSVPRTPHNEQFDFPHDIGKEEFCYWLDILPTNKILGILGLIQEQHKLIATYIP